MSRPETLEPVDLDPQRVSRSGDRTDLIAQIGYWPVDEPFPALLTDAQLRRVLNVSVATFQRLKRLGRFRDLIAAPVLTATPRYSGFLVQQWVSGQATKARAFGQRGARQHVAVR